MAFFFTLLFLTTAYLTPTLLFGQLGQYHVVLLFAVLAFLASIPGLVKSGVGKLPQVYAVLGLAVMVVLSTAKHWLGGIPGALEDFLPVTAAFFLTAINVRKPWQIKLLVLALFLGSVFFIAHGAYDLNNNIIPSPFLYTQEAVPRLRGLGVVNDPNDLAQVLVSLIPLVFLWRTRSVVVNIFLLGIPVAVLVTGMFLTHSRGSSIALMVIVMVAFRRKIGTVPAVILASLLLAGVLAAGWGAGRDVSLEGGAERLDAWATGINFIKHNPVLGIGYQQFKEENYITAHNSVVVCAAENGIPGFLCWVLFVFSSFRFSMKLDPKKDDKLEAEGASTALPPPRFGPPGAAGLQPQHFWAARRSPAVQGATPLPAPTSAAAAAPAVSLDELHRMARLMMIAVTGFLTAGWFLSRAISIWLFMYCGLVCALMRMARDNGWEVPRDRWPFLLRWTAIIGFLLILLVYVILRVRNIVGH